MSGNNKKGNPEPKEDFLDADPEIRGQEYVCLSFISPEAVLKRKDLFMFHKFMRFYEAKVRFDNLEAFLGKTVNDHNMRVQELKESVTKIVENETMDLKEKTTEVNEIVAKAHIPLQDVFDSFRDYIAENRSKIANAENIQDAYEDFMMKKGEELEDEFHQDNSFRTTVRGLKVRGVYSTHKEACARAKKLQQNDPAHNVYVGQVGYWLPWDPEPSRVQEQEYAEKELNELMKRYKENQEKRKELFEADKDRRVSEARKQAGSSSTSVTDGAAASSDNTRIVTESPLQSKEQLRDIREARELMEQMDAERLNIDPAQARNAIADFDRERALEREMYPAPKETKDDGDDN
ncbi:MAG: hypothetical protein EBS07_12180 [Sphingobacteriia bacterium]|jgi:hypothetical protein|nr:hypothetical protein [Sphingobacteriia bacterium]